MAKSGGYTHTHPGQEEMAARQLQQGAVVACS